MLESVASAPPDPILGLGEAFNQDPRTDKVNLTIGVYRDEQGKTPVLECVKQAERWLLESEGTKGYLGIDGLAEFQRLARELTLGSIVPGQRVAAFQSPGGTGALRVAADFAAHSFPTARIWLSNPTWPNHVGVFAAGGLNTQSYPYLASDRKSLDFEGMLDALDREARPGDLICLHACCHNPTGVDPSADQWREIATLTAQRGMLPLIDFAYHGFGDGLEEDTVGIKAIAEQHEEFLVCGSYSKNFGLYSERIGALFAVCATEETTLAVRSNIKSIVRCNYSNPPRHGGAIVACILDNSELRQLWLQELDSMRGRIHAMRAAFVDSMARAGCTTDFSFLLKQRGMFSYSGLTPMQVDWLKREKGIYIVGSGRINVAGITPENLEYLTISIAEALEVK